MIKIVGNLPEDVWAVFVISCSKLLRMRTVSDSL